jgi:hypothetical protein
MWPAIGRSSWSCAQWPAKAAVALDAPHLSSSMLLFVLAQERGLDLDPGAGRVILEGLAGVAG